MAILIDDYINQAKIKGATFNKEIESEKVVQQYRHYIEFFSERETPTGIDQRFKDFELMMSNANKMIEQAKKFN